jgi:hypothetical protein
MSVIPCTQEVEVEGSMPEANLGKKHETLLEK